VTLRNYLLDLYFFLGLVLFTLSRVYDSFFVQIYFFVNFIGLILIVFHLVNLNFKMRISSIGLVLIGLIFYSFGNLLFLSDIDLGFLNLSDIFFLAQVFLKQLFIIRSQNFFPEERVLKLVTLLNIFVLIISLIFYKLSYGYFIDLFYFTESLVSMVFLVLLNFTQSKFFLDFAQVDLDYFFFGQVFWLTGDIVFSNIRLVSYTPFGDLSDIFFFIGFYFFTKSIIDLHKSYNFNIVKIYN